MKRTIVAAAAAFLFLASSAPAQFGSPQAVGGPVGSPAYVVEAKPGGGAIDIGQAFGDAVGPYVDALAQALVAALVSWVLLQIKNRTGIEIDEKQRAAVTQSLQRQASSLVADGLVRLQGTQVTVDNPALVAAAREAMKWAPAAMKHFGLDDPDEVAKRIVDQLPSVDAIARALAQAHDRAAQQAAAWQGKAPS